MTLWQFFAQNRADVWQLTLEHLWMVGISMAIAVAIGVPVGIWLSRRQAMEKPVLGLANVIQTIPSLALFGFLLPAPWIGARAGRIAILALVLYALLPVIRNTYEGIRGVDRAVVEAGKGMGMTGRQLLLQVELPLALSVI
ncbi:MAG TPA: ABC transporter permease, partial [Terriglobales bacterium]|nr:ABC transporter permease [Terriglobales bacterium]